MAWQTTLPLAKPEPAPILQTALADPALIPDIEAFEERVAIHIYDGGIPTDQAKDLAVQAQGFRNQAHYWAWLRVYVERKRLG